MALTTAARVRQRLAIADDSTGVDITASEIDSLIAEMESYTARFCGIAQWESAAYDENHSGTGDRELFLKVPYMTSVSSVTIYSGSDTQTISSDAYRLDQDSACLIMTGGWGDWYGAYGVWPEGWRNIRVQGTGGLESVPADLTHALTEIVVTALLDRHTALSTASSAQDGVQRQIKSPADLVQSYAHLLAPYRRTYA